MLPIVRVNRHEDGSRLVERLCKVVRDWPWTLLGNQINPAKYIAVTRKISQMGTGGMA